MPKKTKISQEDIDTFRKAVEGTKPLVQKKIRLRPPAAARKPATPHQFDKEGLLFSEAQDLDPVFGGEFISHKQSGVSNKTLRKLRKGQYNVDAILDLHGLSVEEAQTAVEDFLQQMFARKDASCAHHSWKRTPQPDADIKK